MMSMNSCNRSVIASSPCFSRARVMLTVNTLWTAAGLTVPSENNDVRGSIMRSPFMSISRP